MLLPSYQQHKKKIYVVGLGITGLATIDSLLASRAEVVAFDDNPAQQAAAAQHGAGWLTPADWQASDGVDILLLSPGIVAKDSAAKKSHPVVRRAKELGVAIKVDVDLLFEEWRASRDFVFITGTNGKSTTTKLATHILAANNMPVAMGGNIGLAALSLNLLAAGGVYVLELSSYQIETMDRPVPKVAILLNLSFDHLERHDTMENYLAIKTKIFGGGDEDGNGDGKGDDDGHGKRYGDGKGDDDGHGKRYGDGKGDDDGHGKRYGNGKGDDANHDTHHPQCSIIGVDDEFCRGFYETHKDRLPLIPISGLGLPAGGVGVLDNNLVDNRDGTKKIITALPIKESLPGPHNAQNLAAAFLLADYYGIGVDGFVAAAKNFAPLPHRQEWVAMVDDVAYVNDSKATNVDATLMSLRSFSSIRWLAGGELKAGDDFSKLMLAANNIKKGYFFGAGARKLQAEVMAKIDSMVFDNLAAALAAARRDAEKGDVILLSPVGASLDQYKNFEERGDDFKNNIAALQKQDG